MGIKIAIDDFDTGYCSLGYLHCLAAETVKIDQSFVRGPSSESSAGRGILQAIICMARALDLHVVAEGVETEKQLLFLEEAGGDVAQGYPLSKPLTSESLTALLDANGTTRAIFS